MPFGPDKSHVGPLPFLQAPKENTEIATLNDTMRHYFAHFVWKYATVRGYLSNALLNPPKSASPKRGRCKRGRTQKHANARKRAQMSANASPQQGAKGRKRAQKSTKERFRVKIANNQVWNNPDSGI